MEAPGNHDSPTDATIDGFCVQYLPTGDGDSSPYQDDDNIPEGVPVEGWRPVYFDVRLPVVEFIEPRIKVCLINNFAMGSYILICLKYHVIYGRPLQSTCTRLLIFSEKDWALEPMETVSLELEDEQKTLEGIVMLDTIAFEQEAEPVGPIVEQLSNNQAPPSLQNYFQDSTMDFSLISDDSGQGFLETSSTINRQDSAMLASCYVDPIFDADPSQVDSKNADEVVLALSNVALDKTSPEVFSNVEISAGPFIAVQEQEQLEESEISVDSGMVINPQAIIKNPSKLSDEPSPELSKFFAEEKFGSDRAGKAFFDALAHTIPASSGTGFANCTSLAPSAGDLSGEGNEHYEVWIPKQSTKQALSTMLSSPPGTYFPEKEHLTMPGVIITEDLRDPVRDLAQQYLGESATVERVTLTADSVSQDEEGLLKLISVGCYRAAVNLTTRLLTLFGQGLKKAGHPSRHTPQSLQIWLVRLTVLLKLRLFNMAEAESEPFSDLDKPDMYYEFYQDVYPNRRGSMVPFALRMLLPQILTCVGKFGDALDRLYSVLNIVLMVLENLEKGLLEDGSSGTVSENRRKVSTELWKKRELKVMYTITNCLVAQNDYFSAYSVLETILKKYPENAGNVRSAQGHVLLQLGDVKSAQASFTLAAIVRSSNTVSDKVANLIDKALMVIATNNFNEALGILKEAQILDSANPVVINNMAVCLLYTGKLRAAFKLLENAIATNPKMYVHECILVNICTLYDLESSRSLQKKSSMLEIVSRHAGDGFNVFCLKLQNTT